jgi:putative membrane protein
MPSQNSSSPARPALVLAASLLSIMVGYASDDAAARRDSIVAAAEEAYAASHRAIVQPDTTDTTARKPVELTDNNILARVAQDDRLELQVARTALAKLTSPALRAFAREIADNHSAGESDARRLSQRLKLPERPAATDTTKAHQQNLVALFTRLNKGLTFDTTYVRHLLDGHTTMLRELKTMEAKATHPEVKALLRNAAPEVQRHLSRASALGKSIMAGRT